MNGVPAKRPTCITVISWVWIVLGGLMALSGAVFTLISLATGEAITTDLGDSEKPPWPLKLHWIVFDNLQLFAALQVPIGVVALIAGIYLLRLRAWARATIWKPCPGWRSRGWSDSLCTGPTPGS